MFSGVFLVRIATELLTGSNPEREFDQYRRSAGVRAGKWRYDSPGISVANRNARNWAFRELIDRICSVKGREKGFLSISERSAFRFGQPDGSRDGRTIASARGQLGINGSRFNMMTEASENAPLFIEAFYNACEELDRRHPEMEMPESRTDRTVS